MAFGCIPCVAASNAVLVLIGALSLPLYFSFYGAEAAVRFSFLLCVHSVLFTFVPQALKSALPMIQLMLFAVLLLLPFNITPTFVVWCYGKFLLFLDPVFSVIEVVQVVLVIMYSSKSFINEIDEQPVKIKSIILAISGISYILSALILWNVIADLNTSLAETWIGCLTVALAAFVFVISLYKDEGIISDAAVVTLVMSFISWAIKQERLLEESSLEIPSQWLQSISDDRSFLNVFLSMTKTSIEHMTCAQRIIQTLLSPSCLLLATVRVGSIVGFAAILESARSNKDEAGIEDTSYLEEPKTARSFVRPLFIRLIIIFVYTERVIRTVISSAEYDSQRRHAMVSEPYILHVSGIRVWRVVQLCVVPSTYVYQLFQSAQLD